MFNPFTEKHDATHQDQDLIKEALAGGSAALENLILRHQAWIYNIALAMTGDAPEAEDITQEILIKMITSLATYDKTKAAFRTWLYRIVANHVISRKRCRKEESFSSLVQGEAYHEYVENIADDGAHCMPENKALTREARNICLTAMLLCLDKRQRLVFILGAVFGVNDAQGGEILDISRDNFRKILSRSRGKLSNFFTKTCSLIDEKNPCTCSRWVVPMQGMNLMAQDAGKRPIAFKRIAEVVEDRTRGLNDMYEREMVALYRELPFAEPPDMVSWIKRAIASEQFKGFMDLP